LIEEVNGCGDDECTKQSAVTVSLNAGTTYYIIASKWGGGVPAADERAMQIEITKAPTNDSCENAATLPLDRTVTGSLTLAANDYEVSTAGPNCYSLPANPFPIGQPASPPSAMGRDVAYAFTAPTDGLYQFKAQSTIGGGDLALHVASSCTSGMGPHTLTDCLGASNRNGNSAEYFATEEVVCAPVNAGQTVYVYVDEADIATAGARFTLEASQCISEVEPNDDTTQPATPACGLVGTILFAGDQDFYTLGSPPAGTRVFAMADGAAANNTDFDMRITTETDTLEYDDANNSTPSPIASTRSAPNSPPRRSPHSSAARSPPPSASTSPASNPTSTSSRDSAPRSTSPPIGSSWAAATRTPSSRCATSSSG